MNVKLLVIVALLFCSDISFSQIEEKDLIVGKTITSQSEIMGDQRSIQIFLPKSYNKLDVDFPVLYILDGQRYFLHGVSLQASFLNFKQTPEFIIVGINRKQSDRNGVYSQDSKKYLSYIENEVIKYVDNKFRTSKDRIIFGWAYGGGFLIQTMINNPKLFDAFIAASPFPIEDKISVLDSLCTERSFINNVLFFTSETNDGAVSIGTEKLNALLIKKAPKEMDWTFKKLGGEEHRSTAFSSLYHGIQNYYKYFPELQFNNLEEFKKIGGLQYVNNYYDQRSKKYGFSSQITDWTMFSLTRNAIRENDFEQFDLFVNVFSEYDFIDRINISRSALIADFYFDNGKYDQALKIFKSLAEKHPKSYMILNRVGDIYKAMKNDENAILFYKKAQENKEN